MRGFLPSAAGRSAPRNALLIEPLEDRVALSATPASNAAALDPVAEIIAEHGAAFGPRFEPPGSAGTHSLMTGATKEAPPEITQSGSLTFAGDTRAFAPFVTVAAVTGEERPGVGEIFVPAAAARFQRFESFAGLAAAPISLADAIHSKNESDLNSGLPQFGFNLRVDISPMSGERLPAFAIDPGGAELGVRTMRDLPQLRFAGDLPFDTHLLAGRYRPDADGWHDATATHRFMESAIGREALEAGFDRAAKLSHLGRLAGVLATGDTDGDALSDHAIDGGKVIASHDHTWGPAVRATGPILAASVNGNAIAAAPGAAFDAKLDADSQFFLRTDAHGRARTATVDSNEWRENGPFASVHWYAGQLDSAYRTFQFLVNSAGTPPGTILLSGLPCDLDAIDDALSAVMSELGRLGDDVESWLDGFPIEAVLGGSSLFAALGLGAWQLARRRSKDAIELETERESSSWLFVRLQSSVG